MAGKTIPQMRFFWRATRKLVGDAKKAVAQPRKAGTEPEEYLAVEGVRDAIAIGGWLSFLASLVILFVGIAPATAGERFRFPEAHYGAGELRYIDDFPVLTVSGSPEQIGAQIGALAMKPAGALAKYFHEYLRKKGLDAISSVIFAAAEGFYKRFPSEYRREMEAMIEAGGADRNLILLANTIFDLKPLVSCSGLLVSPQRSATAGTLYGRNSDRPFDDLLLIADYSLVIVYRPTGRKAFAMVTFPGLLASNCGMNENGLTLGANTASKTGDGTSPYDPVGIPYAVAAREVMEGCGSVEDFDRWIRGHARTSMGLLLACDRQMQRVYEITTKNIGVREPIEGLVCCTNHFRLAPMAVSTACSRYEKLEKAREKKQLGVNDVAQPLNDANQGKRTIQTMVFEPANLVLHLSIGRGPTSVRPLKKLELKPLLQGQ